MKLWRENADLHGVAHDLQAIPITKWVIKKKALNSSKVCVDFDK